jgi:hypothetical protein
MSATAPGPEPQSTRAQRWLARLSFVLAGLAIAILVIFAGLASLAMLAIAVASAVVGLAAALLYPPAVPDASMPSRARRSGVNERHEAHIKSL